jgi:hypothetical protein
LLIEGSAGDSIFFHYKCIHGSQENHWTPRTLSSSTASTVACEDAEKRAAEARKQNQLWIMARGFRRYRD